MLGCKPIDGVLGVLSSNQIHIATFLGAIPLALQCVYIQIFKIGGILEGTSRYGNQIVVTNVPEI